MPPLMEKVRTNRARLNNSALADVAALSNAMERKQASGVLGVGDGQRVAAETRTRN